MTIKFTYLICDSYGKKFGSTLKMTKVLFFSSPSREEWASGNIYFLPIMYIIMTVMERRHYHSDRCVFVKRWFCNDLAVNCTQKLFPLQLAIMYNFHPIPVKIFVMVLTI